MHSLGHDFSGHRWALPAVVALTLGCGRSDLLAEDLGAPPASDAPDASTLPDARADSAAAPGLDDGSSDAVSTDGPASVSTGDAEAGPAAIPDSGCGPGRCHGCCREDGVCVREETQTAAFCGSGGLGCIMCPDGVACGIDTADGTRVCGHFL